MLRRSMMAAGLACAAAGAAQAQQQQGGVFDSGWRQVSAAALPDLELDGAGVRINNLVVSGEPARNNRAMAQHTFRAASVKRGSGRRQARVELVGLAENGRPTIVSVVLLNLREEANATDTGTHRFAAFPDEVAGTKGYWVRLVVQ